MNVVSPYSVSHQLLSNKLSTVSFILRRSSYILNLDTMTIIHVAQFHTFIKYGKIFCDHSTILNNIYLIQKKDNKNYVGNRYKELK
jgi:hypothetical protein